MLDTAFELRLGLVLYGGSSLAVYMSGMTQELLALARAGHARRLQEWLEQGAPERPGWDEGWVRRWVARQERDNPYCGLLKAAAIDVVIDVLAGTSAGGLNGLMLAKALACGAPDLGGLGDLWRDGAQIADLARFDRDPRSVLSGDYLQEQMQTVMAGLSAAGRRELADLCSVLDLFVTATDVRGHAWTRWDKFHQKVRGTSHKYLFRLKKRTPYGAGRKVRGYSRNDFVADRPEAQGAVDTVLSKIGRATSAFPGVFPPVLISPREAREAGIRVMEDLAGEYDEGVWFSDGGMLLNAPFEPVLETIFGRPATRPVKRVLAFLEPDPSCAAPPAARAEPAMLETVLSAVTLPMQQDILDKLDRMAVENQRRARLMELMKGLDYGLGQMAGGHDTRVITAFARMRRNPGEEPAVTAMSGPAAMPEMDAYAVTRTYYQMRLNRLRQVLRDAMARALEGQGLVAAALDRATGLIMEHLEPPGSGDLVDRPGELVAFLETYDLEYHARRIQYLLGRIHDQYRPGVRTCDPGAMTRVLELLWGAAADWRYALWAISQMGRPALDVALGEEQARRLAGALTDLAGRMGDAGGDSAREAARAVAVALTDYMAVVHDTAEGDVQEALAEADRALDSLQTAGTDQLTGAVLRRTYEEFASLDVILFPITVGAGEDGWEQIALYGLRPNAATWVPRSTAEKLTGEGLGHFAAFLDPRWRSNDMLWGHLDGAELLFRMIAQEAGVIPAEGGAPLPPEVQGLLTQRRRQILAEFPDLVDLPKLRSLALPAEELPDDVMREYLTLHYRVGLEGLDELPPRRLAAELLLILDNTVKALGRSGASPLVYRLQQGLSVVLRPLNWIARLVLLPQRGLAGTVQENLGPLMTLLGVLLLASWALGAVTLSRLGTALVVALFLPALVDLLFRPTWLKVLLLALPAAITGAAAGTPWLMRVTWLVPALTWLGQWPVIGRLWAPFVAVFLAASIAWWSAWRWRGPLRRIRVRGYDKGSGT